MNCSTNFMVTLGCYCFCVKIWVYKPSPRNKAPHFSFQRMWRFFVETARSFRLFWLLTASDVKPRFIPKRTYLNKHTFRTKRLNQMQYWIRFCLWGYLSSCTIWMRHGIHFNSLVAYAHFRKTVTSAEKISLLIFMQITPKNVGCYTLSRHYHCRATKTFSITRTICSTKTGF
jgi:hypothetical protein